MYSDERRAMSDERGATNEERRTKNDERRATNEERRTKSGARGSDEQGRMNGEGATRNREPPRRPHEHRGGSVGLTTTRGLRRRACLYRPCRDTSPTPSRRPSPRR